MSCNNKINNCTVNCVHGCKLAARIKNSTSVLVPPKPVQASFTILDTLTLMKTQGQEWYRNERASTRAMTSTKETDASGCVLYLHVGCVFNCGDIGTTCNIKGKRCVVIIALGCNLTIKLNGRQALWAYLHL